MSSRMRALWDFLWPMLLLTGLYLAAVALGWAACELWVR